MIQFLFFRDRTSVCQLASVIVLGLILIYTSPVYAQRRGEVLVNTLAPLDNLYRDWMGVKWNIYNFSSRRRLALRSGFGYGEREEFKDADDFPMMYDYAFISSWSRIKAFQMSFGGEYQWYSHNRRWRLHGALEAYYLRRSGAYEVVDFSGWTMRTSKRQGEYKDDIRGARVSFGSNFYIHRRFSIGVESSMSDIRLLGHSGSLAIFETRHRRIRAFSALSLHYHF